MLKDYADQPDFALAWTRHQLESENGNWFASPFSLWVALAMLELAPVRKLLTTIKSRGEISSQEASFREYLKPDVCLDDDEFGFHLHVANALWVQNGYPIKPAYVSELAQGYDASCEQVDFASDPEDAGSRINTWVSDNTQARIESILDPKQLDRLTRFVLANAVYFKARPLV